MPTSTVAASAPVGAVAIESPEAQARAALKQRMKADWCGFGAAEHGRQSQAIFERVSANGGTIDMAAIEASNRTPGAELVADAMDATRRRWVEALVQRGDLRSLAVADFLGGVDGDDATARARLQARARTSSDPMVTALALQRPCEGGGCVNIEASQWSRLEPANLQAWLSLLSGSRGVSGQTLTPYAMDRMRSEARFSRSYEREVKALLLSLPQTETPGLAVDAEVQLVQGTAAAWSLGGLRPVMAACRAVPPVDSTGLQRCAAMAELMWQGDTMLDRALAIGVVRRLLPAYPALRTAWEARAQTFEAAQRWMAEQPGVPAADEVGHCESVLAGRLYIREMAEQGEWRQLRASMQAARADDALLSAQWRRDAGRGALDPDRPASSTAR